MMIEFSQKFDAVINIITALALIYYASYMNIVEKNGGLRKRLLFLLSMLAILCLTRGVNYLMNFGQGVEAFVLVISSIIPLALFLLIELMLRRHLPLPLKLFAGLSSIFLSLAFMIFGINKYTLLCLMAFYVLTLLSMLSVMFLKKDFELDPAEMSLIKICMVIMFLIVPLIVTDFKIILGWDTIRLGAFGILFFLYSLVKIWDNIDLKGGFSRIVYLLIFNLASAAVISWLFDIKQYYFHVLIIFIMLRMFSDVLIYSRDSYTKKAQEMTRKIIDAFMNGDLKLEAIKKEISNGAFYLLTKKDLLYYKPDRIANAFQEGGLKFKSETLKQILDQDTREEIVHLYDDFDCNACIFLKLSSNDFLIILFKWPAMAPKSKLEKEISLIQNLALKIKE
jgi:hypothetical protein